MAKNSFDVQGKGVGAEPAYNAVAKDGLCWSQPYDAREIADLVRERFSSAALASAPARGEGLDMEQGAIEYAHRLGWSWHSLSESDKDDCRWAAKTIVNAAIRAAAKEVGQDGGV